MHPIKPEHNVFTLTPTYIGDSVGYVFNNTHEAFEDVLHKVVNTRDYQIIKSDNEDPYYRYGVWVGESRIGWLIYRKDIPFETILTTLKGITNEIRTTTTDSV